MSAPLPAGADVPEEDQALPWQYSEERLAAEYTRLHGDDWKYVAEFSKWFWWDGFRWRTDLTLRAFDLARELARHVSAHAHENPELSRSQQKRVGAIIGSAKTVASIERLARADRGHAMPAEAFDKYSMMLNTPSGVLDLTSGDLLDRDKSYYMTKSTGGGLGDKCPTWFKFIDRVTGNDRELAKFLQRFAGYCLTGDTSSHALLFLFGLGANGKSTFANALIGMLGDYATTAPTEMFVESFTARHPTEIARLRAARLVVVQEVEDGQRWATAKIKQLTGGDRVTAHFMRQDFFEYTPQFKLLFCGNHKPSLRTVDEALKRRFHLVPFTETIPPAERDPELSTKLRAEWGGILRWALQGCLEWREIGLAPPEAVRKATDLYMGDEDLIGGWMNECCEQEARAFVPVADLHKSYQTWAERAGEKFFGQKRFSQTIEDHGYERARDSSSRIRGFRGLRLRRAQGRLEGVA